MFPDWNFTHLSVFYIQKAKTNRGRDKMVKMEAAVISCREEEEEEDGAAGM